MYTNPEPETLVSHRDRAFVLGIEVADELQGDKYELLEKEQEVSLGATDLAPDATEPQGGKTNLRGIENKGDATAVDGAEDSPGKQSDALNLTASK